MAKNRVLQNCPECDQKEAATSKSCRKKNCRNFTKQTRSRSKKSASKADLTTRRAKRERKQNPKFIDSEEKPTVNGNAKKRVRRPKSVSTEITPRRSQRNTEEAKAARAKRKAERKVPTYGGEDVCAKLSKEKQELAALFLSEINRKLSSVVWKI